MTTPDLYEVFAVKYAHHERRASANFIGGDPHDGPMPLDYFVWLVRGATRSFVVDLGFNAATAASYSSSPMIPILSQAAPIVFGECL